MNLRKVNNIDIEFVINNKLVKFSKSKKSNEYIIVAGKNKYRFSSFKKAINANVVKSNYNQWLNLKDLNKIDNYTNMIYNYKNKIDKIELKGLIEGKNIFINKELDIVENKTLITDYDDENDDVEEVVW